MSAEQDAGKSGKKLFSLIGFGALIVLTGGYWLVSWLTHDAAGTDSAVNLNGTASSSTAPTTETPRYRELLKASNDAGADEAARTNSSFIASLPVGLETTEPPPDKLPEKPPEVKPQIRTAKPAPAPRTPESDAAAQQVNEKRQAQLQKLLTRISAAQGAGEAPVLATAFVRTEGSARMADSAVSAEQTSASQEEATVFVPALSRASAYIETAVNSDNPNSQVVAVIPAGQWAGARLHSGSVKLVGDGVEIRFTRMSWRGMQLNVNAWGQSEKDLTSSVATEVNHRWGTHVVLPAILAGLGETGGLYKDANTQILQTDVSTVTSRPGNPDAGTVAGVMLGGMAQSGADVITKEVTREPFRQVKVKQNEVVSILFVDAVTADDITGSKAAITPAAGTSVPPPTAAVQQTETRLQDAIARRQAEIRRQYGDPQPRED